MILFMKGSAASMAKSVFFDQWNNRPPVEVTKFPMTEPVFVPEKLDSGEWVLSVSGEHNVYNAIQSHADETDLRQILAKCQATGDYSALHQRNVVFADLTGMPGDFTVAQNRALLARDRFNALDPDIKAAFKSFDDFADQILKGEFSDDVMSVFDKRAQAAAAAAAPVQVKSNEE